MKRRLAFILAPFLIVFGLGFGFATSAHAAGTEICSITSQGNPASPCLNKWNDGSLIKAYTPGATNENYVIQLTGDGSGNVQIYDPNTGQCVGDYQNNSGDAKASDYENCPSSGVAGWGTVFSYYSTGCPNASGVLYNHHWNGDLSANAANGSQFYLNVGSNPYCLKQFST